MGESALDIVFPPSCVACGRVLRAAAFFCEDCELEISPLPPTRCARCAEPGEFGAATCPRCAARPPAFDGVHAPFAHEGPVARAIHRFKYEDHPELAAPLVGLLCQELASFLARAPRHVCALPLHPARRAERKFDQAELLAGELCRVTGRQRLFLLDRVRRTERQVGLSELAREQNVQGAFVAREGAVQGLDLLLVDDVVTTGATARAAAFALKQRGARSVQVLALARAYPG
jgi:ComF family protein